MIWRDFYIEMAVGETHLRTCLAAALNVNIECVAVVADERKMPEAGVATAVAVLRSVVGDCQLMASVYLFGQSDAIAMMNDRAVAQVLADNLGCAILLPDDDEQDASCLCASGLQCSAIE